VSAPVPKLSAFLRYFAESQREGRLKMLMKSNVLALPVRRVLQKVRGPGRLTDQAYGRKETKYLSPNQVEALIKAAKGGRCGERDALMIRVAYHYALRVSELVHLQWDQIDLEAGVISVARLKNGVGGPQHLTLEDKRALRRLKAETGSGRYVFLSERGDPLTRDAFAKQLAAIGKRARPRSSALPSACSASRCGACVGKWWQGQRIPASGRHGSPRCTLDTYLCAGRCRLDQKALGLIDSMSPARLPGFFFSAGHRTGGAPGGRVRRIVRS
jgi:integrase